MVKISESQEEFIVKFMESLEINDCKEKLEEFKKAYKKARPPVPEESRCSSITKSGTRCSGRKLIDCSLGLCNIHKKAQDKIDLKRRQDILTDTDDEKKEDDEAVVDVDVDVDVVSTKPKAKKNKTVTENTKNTENTEKSSSNKIEQLDNLIYEAENPTILEETEEDKEDEENEEDEEEVDL